MGHTPCATGRERVEGAIGDPETEEVFTGKKGRIVLDISGVCGKILSAFGSGRVSEKEGAVQ